MFHDWVPLNMSEFCRFVHELSLIMPAASQSQYWWDIGTTQICKRICPENGNKCNFRRFRCQQIKFKL